MEPRDRAEQVIRRFHALEVARGGDPVIDYDCAPTTTQVEPYPDRLTALNELTSLVQTTEPGPVADQAIAHTTYLSALLGERRALDDYLLHTQGCHGRGWTEEYVEYRGDLARAALADLGIAWGEKARDNLRELDEELESDEVTDTVGAYATEYEPVVRELTSSTAEFRLTVENVESDEYWSYWLDGAGHDVRLRINRSAASFTRSDACRFALHEILGHALQYVSLTEFADRHDVLWPRLLAVHSNHQVLLEGLGQALPLIVQSEDPLLTAASRLEHHGQLVRAELHVLVNRGATITECRDRASAWAPYLLFKDIEREFRDRSRDPRLRSYLWAYPAGLDWFVNLWERAANLLPEVLRAAYEQPLSPSELHAMWPAGPVIGGDR